MSTVGEKLIELHIATRSACKTKVEGDVSLRTKVLFLTEKFPRTPLELMDMLLMVKSNLAILCNNMCKDGVITKEKSISDKRTIKYAITPKGRDELASILKAHEEKFKSIFSTKNDYASGLEKFDAVLDLLSFIS